MNPKQLKALKAFVLLIIGVGIGILISSRFDIRIAGISGSANYGRIETCGSRVKPFASAPEGGVWECHCEWWGCRWVVVYGG